jgi:hypothetical protein
MKRIVVLWLILIVVSALRIAMLFDSSGDGAAAEAPARNTQPATIAGANAALIAPHAVAARERPTQEHSASIESGPPAPPAPAARSIELGLTELTRLLETRVLGRTRWELAARGLSASLGEEAAPALLAIVADGRRTSFDLIAAAELLRRNPSAPDLPPEGLARLRQVAFGGLPDSASATASRRVVAQLGDWSDRLELVRTLEEPPTPEARIAAAWCLQAATQHDVLLDLAQVIDTDPESHASELTVLVIESILRHSPPIHEQLRTALTTTVLAAIQGAAPGSALPTRVAGLLEALGGETARSALLSMASEGPAHGAAARALSRDADGRQRLLRLVTDNAVGESERLSAASALIRASEPHHAIVGTAVDGLRRVLETAADPEDRRQAVLILAECGTDTSRLVLEHALLDDRDTSVRAAAVIAMTRFEDRECFAYALETCASRDLSVHVRELATGALERDAED